LILSVRTGDAQLIAASSAFRPDPVRELGRHGGWSLISTPPEDIHFLRNLLRQSKGALNSGRSVRAIKSFAFGAHHLSGCLLCWVHDVRRRARVGRSTRVPGSFIYPES
jgi:hypothetical protein